ncbi:MAG: methyl-accepting chemotaxis protein [Myxococcales bacterium]
MKLVYKVATPALVAALVVVALIVVWGTLGASTRRAMGEVKQGYLPALQTSQALEQAMTSIQRVMLDAVIAEDADALEAIGPLEKSFLSNLEQARANPVVPPARIAALSAEFQGYLSLARGTSAAMIRKDPAAAAQLDEVSSRYSKLGEALREATARDRADLDASLVRALEGQDQTAFTMLACMLAALLATGGATLWILRALRPLRALTAGAAAVASGDLTAAIQEQDGADEVGQLSAAFAKMVVNLREAHAVIQGSVQRLASAASQIQASTREQEAASAQQASAVEEVSRTMQGLLESATHISDSAQGVLGNAERAKQTSDLMATKTADLSAQTARMNEILEVIREIADRSDLLALNASLEGTRAGEAGKGFSLVAAEIRRLSERVGASVADVKGMLSEIRASSSATVLVTEESRKLAESTTASARQITLVTQQQRTATEQVSHNMAEAANVIMQSTTVIGQVRAAAEDLKNEAEALARTAASFRIGQPARSGG